MLACVRNANIYLKSFECDSSGRDWQAFEKSPLFIRSSVVRPFSDYYHVFVYKCKRINFFSCVDFRENLCHHSAFSIDDNENEPQIRDSKKNKLCVRNRGTRTKYQRKNVFASVKELERNTRKSGLVVATIREDNFKNVDNVYSYNKFQPDEIE